MRDRRVSTQTRIRPAAVVDAHVCIAIKLTFKSSPAEDGCVAFAVVRDLALNGSNGLEPDFRDAAILGCSRPKPVVDSIQMVA
jgi:hypothetical protein